LVKNQSAPANNGIYVVSATGWTRATDASTSALVAGEVVSVLSGTANGGSVWTTDFKSTDTLNTTAMYWSAVMTDYQVNFTPVFMLGGM
jgi:phage-related tail fiber protein